MSTLRAACMAVLSRQLLVEIVSTLLRSIEYCHWNSIRLIRLPAEKHS